MKLLYTKDYPYLTVSNFTKKSFAFQLLYYAISVKILLSERF